MIHTSNFPVNCSAEGRLTVSICVRYQYLWCSALIGQLRVMLDCDWLMRLRPGVSLHPPTTACLPPCYKWGENSIVRMWELITLITLIQLTSSIHDYVKEKGEVGVKCPLSKPHQPATTVVKYVLTCTCILENEKIFYINNIWYKVYIWPLGSRTFKSMFCVCFGAKVIIMGFPGRLSRPMHFSPPEIADGKKIIEFLFN